MAREVLVAGDGVSGARKGQSVEALPEDREVVVEEILERPVVGRRLVVRRREPERVVQRRLAGGVRKINVRAEEQEAAHDVRFADDARAVELRPSMLGLVVDVNALEEQPPTRSPVGLRRWSGDTCGLRARLA